MPGAVVIVNPTKFDDLDAVRQEVAAAARGVGLEPPDVVETTEADPGFGQTREALSRRPHVVCALGGDGTVRAVAQVLAGTGVPLGLLPGGTGNLLARNVGAPVDDLTEAVTVALRGRDRTIDAGWVIVDPTAAQLAADDPAAGRPDNAHLFTVMAGLGFDAAMMDDAPKSLKDKVGWAAYLVSATKNLGADGFAATVSVDGMSDHLETARTIVVGNCGTLTAGLALFPDAALDDGVLDVATLTPDRLAAWIGPAAKVLSKDPSDSPSIERQQGRDIVVSVDPEQRVEADGDVLESATRLRLVIDPGALVIRVAGG
ncbi:diacylglycerol/lipid kinase family protein [Leekyejoonella antrihumi]|uniref:Diacylglycerol kinase family lipid kinase n=1 Tax=Leekyejoonella antrihumi TaxID=1660198 RepID=A0A563DVE3_9MICO|nr:diacylglycerol kinase family protein [Leekyejoonella antrihumi]TWP34230.1 diacylglycerol kinase family lipid kinase [Leekyejoonella antrihumi]